MTAVDPQPEPALSADGCSPSPATGRVGGWTRIVTALALAVAAVAAPAALPPTSATAQATTSPPSTTNSTIPPSTDQMRVIPQTPYYPGGPTFDAYLPLDGAPTHPALIMVHGGGWEEGDKATYAPYAVKAATEQHWAAFAVNYRLDAHDKAAWADELHDIQAAIRYVVANASTYGVDPNRVVLLGGSAGANLVALISEVGTVNPVKGTAVGASPTLSVPIRAAALWSPPVDLADLVGHSGHPPSECGADKACDFIWTAPDIVDYLGCPLAACPQTYQEASPISWVSSTTAPSFVANSTDELIPLGQVQSYVGALEKAGVAVQFDQLPGTRHSSAYGDDVWAPTSSFLAERVDGPAASGSTSPSRAPSDAPSVAESAAEPTDTSPGRPWAPAVVAALVLVLIGLGVGLGVSRRRRASRLDS